MVNKKTAKKKKSTRSHAPARGPLALKKTLESAFRREFPNDTVDISDGYKGNVHVLIVSRKFDDLSESDKADLLERIIQDAGLTSAQKARISLLLGLSPNEIK